MAAPVTKAPNQKKLRSTPLARRRLEAQLLDLADPESWPSPHLRRAYEIVAKCKPAEIAKQIVLDSVRAADRAMKAALNRDLASGRRSALADFVQNCRTIANCTKPTRLRKEIRTDLNSVARSTLVAGPVDVESVQEFLCSCRNIVELRLEDEDASTIHRHLVASKGDVTHGEDLPLDVRTPTITVLTIPPQVRLTGRRTPKIATDYEALPPQARLACENALQVSTDERLICLTAHDVFASLYTTSHSFASAQDLEAEPQIIGIYLGQIEQIWTENGLEFGRGYNELQKNYLSPFHEFSERILLDRRDPGSRIFSPLSEDEMRSARQHYYTIPLSSRDNISAAPFAGNRVITEHVLRSYLERSSKK